MSRRRSAVSRTATTADPPPGGWGTTVVRMFDVDRRAAVRSALLSRAQDDPGIVSAAVTGSAASGSEDRWSDVDLLFGVRDGVRVTAVLPRWSEHVYAELGAVHHVDLGGGDTVYRAFLLSDLLEVDLGFTAQSRFRAVGDGGFAVVFGTAEPPTTGTQDAAHWVGRGWHHTLHARAALHRGRVWRAAYWVACLRDVTVVLAAGRLGLATEHAKGADDLPADVLDRLGPTFVREVTAPEVDRALRAATAVYLEEARRAAPQETASLGAMLGADTP